MKNVLRGKNRPDSRNSFGKVLAQVLFVDIIPVVLLLAFLASGMSYVSAKLSEPCSVEIAQLDKKTS